MTAAPTAPLRVFIGTEDSQVVAHQVLEHSIRTHASVPVEITPMLNLPMPVPAEPANRARVGFSFTRFKIPELCGYEGRAVYIDADMLVFGDVAELAAIPFDGNKLLCTYQTELPSLWAEKHTFRPGRNVAVMLLDCSRLDWKADEIVGGLDEGRYTYEQLIYDQCLVAPDEIADTIPVEWNHLERYEHGRTRLLHYTVVRTQPWKNNRNPLGHLWMTAYAKAVQVGAVSPEDVERSVAAGYVKPALAQLLELAPDRPRPAAEEAHRDLALAKVKIADLERRIEALLGSSSWKVGNALTGVARKLRGRQIG